MFGDLVPRSWTRELAALDTLFEDVFGPRRTDAPHARQWWPAIEGHVKDDTLVVRADLPGVDPQHVEVSLDGTELRIAGERKFEQHEDTKGSRYSEVRYGRFERTLTVPEGLDAEKMTARYTNGVLEITAPVAAARTPRKVPIEVSGPTAPAPSDKKAA